MRKKLLSWLILCLLLVPAAQAAPTGGFTSGLERTTAVVDSYYFYIDAKGTVHSRRMTLDREFLAPETVLEGVDQICRGGGGVDYDYGYGIYARRTNGDLVHFEFDSPMYDDFTPLCKISRSTVVAQNVKSVTVSGIPGEGRGTAALILKQDGTLLDGRSLYQADIGEYVWTETVVGTDVAEVVLDEDQVGIGYITSSGDLYLVNTLRPDEKKYYGSEMTFVMGDVRAAAQDGYIMFVIDRNDTLYTWGKDWYAYTGQGPHPGNWERMWLMNPEIGTRHAVSYYYSKNAILENVDRVFMEDRRSAEAAGRRQKVFAVTKDGRGYSWGGVSDTIRLASDGQGDLMAEDFQAADPAATRPRLDAAVFSQQEEIWDLGLFTYVFQRDGTLTFYYNEEGYEFQTTLLTGGVYGQLSSPGATSPAAPRLVYHQPQTILLDGRTVQLDAYAKRDAAGNATNYVRLVDAANALRVSGIRFDATEGAALAIRTGRTAEEDPIPGPTGTRFYDETTIPVTIDGHKAGIETIQLTDDSGNRHTYVKLSDLIRTLGFEISWDGTARCIVISTKKGDPIVRERRRTR